MPRVGFIGILIAGLVVCAVAPRGDPPPDAGGNGAPDSAQNSPAVEALSRLEGIDLERNPAVKRAVLKVLASTRGTPEFVEIVKKFELKDQDEGLLEVSRKSPDSDAGVEAMRMILARGDTGLLKTALKSTNSAEAGRVLEAMGNAKQKQVVPLALEVLNDGKRDASARRQAIRALAQTEEGAGEVLALVKHGKLAPDVMFAAGSALNAVRWPALKAEAARLMPPPQGRNQESLPPVGQLLKMKGDAANGAKVMARPETACLNCHSVNGQGAHIGPDLSQIGTKLGKDALCEAILDPSAGIAFGYEAWQIQLKSGDEAYGLVVSDTADELSVKDLKGIVTRYKKSEIASREQLKTSIMPVGLQASMTTQEFVDLVEYLSTLKKPAE